MDEEIRYQAVPGGNKCEYRIGDDGVAWSRRPGKEWKPLKSSPQKSGHRRVSLGRGHENMRYVHRLVLEAFVGQCPEGLEACHKDDDPSNNRLDNLYWGTPSQNRLDGLANGKWKRGQHSHLAKLSDGQVLELIATVRSGSTHRATAGRFGVSVALVEKIMYGHAWGHLTGIPRRPRKERPAPDA